MKMLLPLSGLVLLALAVSGSFGVAGSSIAVPMVQTKSDVVVATFYYPWYGYNQTSGNWTGGWNSSHWSRADGIVTKPQIGYYSSMSNDTLKWQFQKMEKWNISVLIVSFWGARDYGTEAILNLFRYIQGTNSSMKVALMMEPASELNVTVEQNYVWQLYQKYPTVIFNWEDKPLLAYFNPLNSTGDSRFTERVVGQMNYVDWQYWQGLPDHLRRYGGTWNMNQIKDYEKFPIVAGDGEVTVIANYDDSGLYYAGSRMHHIRFTGMLDTELNYAKVNASLIILCSFNEYSEQTALEDFLDGSEA